MDAQSYTAQERRAANQIWAAAGAYGFEPLFLARYTDGTTDFYMNTVVGLTLVCQLIFSLILYNFAIIFADSASFCPTRSHKTQI